MTTEDDEFHQYLAEMVDGLNARVVVLAVITNDDNLRVATIGAGGPPDIVELEQTFHEVIEAIKEDLVFSEPQGNA